MELIKGLLQEPQRIIFYGPEGIGKSTLASQLPDPIFIDTEGSTGDLDVIRTPPLVSIELASDCRHGLRIHRRPSRRPVTNRRHRRLGGKTLYCACLRHQ